jgi:putative DNA primase/helicase
VKACKKFCDSYDFTPRCKVWMACNSALEAPGLSEDDAYWQRQKTIPFDVKFRDVEGVEIKDLDQKLLAEESSGILNYFLRGLAEYREIGMAEPEETKAKTEELRDDADFVGRFLEDRTEKTENSHEMVEQSALYATYSETAEKTREGRMSKQKFGKALEARGHKRTSVKVNGKTRRVWDKLKLVYAAYQSSTEALMKDETF